MHCTLALPVRKAGHRRARLNIAHPATQVRERQDRWEATQMRTAESAEGPLEYIARTIIEQMRRTWEALLPDLA